MNAQFSLCVYWVPGVSVAILVSAVGIPHYLALLCVDPLRVFAFLCFTGIFSMYARVLHARADLHTCMYINNLNCYPTIKCVVVTSLSRIYNNTKSS